MLGAIGNEGGRQVTRELRVTISTTTTPSISVTPSVLLVGEYGALNGGENSLLAVLPALQTAGCRFVALVPPDTDFSRELHALGVELVPFEPVAGHSRLPQNEIRAAIQRVIEAVRPDLLHANSLSMSRLCGPVAAATGTPGVGYLRDIVGLSQRAIADLGQLDRLVAVSLATRNFHVQQGLDPERVVVVHNGVDLERFCSSGSDDAQGVREELNLRMDSPLLLSVGQIGMRKGLDTLLQAFSMLRAKSPQLHLAIVGSRHSQKQEAIEYELRLHQAADQCGHVHWLGRRDDVHRLMRAATLLVHAARQEPLGRVLLEASAAGLPFVATNVGGTAEIVPESLSSDLLCDKDQPAAMATTAERLLKSSALRGAIGQQLRKSAEQRFSQMQCASGLVAIYNDLLE